MDARDSEALFQKILYAREAKGEQRAKLYQRTDEHTMTYKYKDITGVIHQLVHKTSIFFSFVLILQHGIRNQSGQVPPRANPCSAGSGQRVQPRLSDQLGWRVRRFR